MDIESIFDEWDNDNKKRNIPDGVYDASGVTEFLCCDGEFVGDVSEADAEKIISFCERHPNWVMAAPYQTRMIVFCSNRPVEFTGEREGTGFNYGSCNLLQNCPSKLLILAEDD